MKTNQYAEFVDNFLNKSIEILAPITKLEYLLAVVIFLLLWTFLLTIRLKKIANRKGEGFDRVVGLNDRVAKLQIQVGDVKTESKNNFDALHAGIKSLQIEVESLREKLSLAEEQSQPTTEQTENPPQETTKVISLKAESALDRKPEPEISPAAQITSKETEAQVDPDSQAVDVHSQVTAVEESLASRLKKTRLGLFDKIKSIFSLKSNLDEELISELEALLITSDLGINTVRKLMDELKSEVKQGRNLNEEAVRAICKMKLLSILENPENDQVKRSFYPAKALANGPLVVMLVGVNGAGKTTTAAKLAQLWHQEGAKVLLAAADTFRAAAVEQLTEWGRRVDIPVISGVEDCKPATVVFDAIKKGIDEKFDVLIIDTAGRLHTKSNLMQELEGINNVLANQMPGSPHEVILVVDGSTGQNALIQAKEFNSSVKLTGLVVTKLDGTPKGGIVIAIKDEMGIPVRFIGVGEKPQDLKTFEPREFIEAIFDQTEIGQEAKINKVVRKRRETN